MGNSSLTDLAMLVVLPLVVGNGGGLVCRPLTRRRRHAEGSGGIEMGGGCDRLRLARTVQWTRPRLGGQPRGRWWPTSRSAACSGLQRERRRLLVEFPGALG